ncbi:MAG: hypothetical protein LBK67_12600 [Coriobacteriales bacterium]|jgi:hypothetical protein|nr:hypothetical protein [Coriobacteriales bacterium]
MNKTPIIIVMIIAIIVLCCCSICALLWTVTAWQRANEPYQYEGERVSYTSADVHGRCIDVDCVVCLAGDDEPTS